ncbi:tetratricopeptide repeat protein 17 [Biomphalaria pfeifferi]|uniref:Tetratricopeptide repeat protein 17 n=1 Tax=Biomphalaria pfeifferi TaxID=112525 RepID=A0AAD8F840_BIOPF|nr:tetratricopeptide repeat protein 17 [Biomphalaria pfeifferi]
MFVLIMASAIRILLFVSLLLQKCRISNGSNHWIVTEDGKIQAQVDSVYSMRRPYDLVAFMKQEERANMLNSLKKELLSRKDEIDKNEDRDTGLEQKFYKTNPDCIEAGKPLPEFDLYISTVLPLENKGIRPEEYIDINAPPIASPKSPECSVFTDLDFSIHAFEHLEGMKARHNLSGTPELGLKNAITHKENVDDYGHLVYEALTKNKTSWILYNMAAFYWRIKGNPYQAVECIRRALHHSPRLQKDVALISLANILHRARFSSEAAILVHAALEMSKELNVNHFTLGNIYAVLGEYNKSIICFENTLKIQPDFEAAAKRRHAVLCHSKLELALEAQHRSLQRTLKDLKDYQRKHDLFQTQSDKLLAEQVPHEVKVSQHYAYEQLKLREKTSEMGEFCRMVDKEGKQVLLCTWSRRSPTLDFNFAFLDESEDKAKEKNKSEKLVESAVNPKSPDYGQPVRAPIYSKYKKHKPSDTDAHLQQNWPRKDECDSMVKKVPDPRNLTTIYLSPENKGFEVKELLSSTQGLEPGGEHPLPWYPPVCVPLMELAEGNPTVYDHLKSVSYAERSRIPLKYNDLSMREILLSLVNDGAVTEEEVGQRILTALKQNIGPQWILYNLAGLYWRIIGNNYHGIECIRRSIYLCPQQYKDVPLVNLANILYRYGRYDDAIIIMRDALDINDAEPSTHFFLGHLLWATRNYTGATHHYHEALAADPSYQGALDAVRAMKCYLKYHHAAQSAAPQESPANGQGNNCQPKPSETESRVICKTENNEEKCIIETRSRNRIADCNGQCTQTCTITPVKVDGCSSSNELNLENSISYCSGKGVKQFSSEQDEMLFSTDFTSKLDEVSQYYEKKGLCEGDECSHLRVQCLLPMTTHSGLIAHVITPPKLFVRPVAYHAAQCPGNQRPHTKLEYVEGVLKHQLIFLQVSPSEMQIDAEDCVIFNDGTKSAGCSREEFRTYIEEVSSDLITLEEMSFLSQQKFHGEDGERFVPNGWKLVTVEGVSKGFLLEKISLDSLLSLGKEMSENLSPKQSKEVESAPQDVMGPPSTVKTNPEVEAPTPMRPRSSEVKASLSTTQKPDEVEAPPFLSSSSRSKVEALRSKYTEDIDLPDPSVHLRKLIKFDWPTVDCAGFEQINFEEFTSTWLCPTAKEINLADYIDFSSLIKHGTKEPWCGTEQVSPLRAMDHLLGVQTREDQTSASELALTQVLQSLGGESEPSSIIGTRIADALTKNSSSWIAYTLASLYWRIEGDSEKAIDCIRMALTYVPHLYKDTALVSLANLLHQSGYLNDAIVVANAALDVDDRLSVTHFTMANLYAAKGDWEHARLFYQSTLGLQPAFQPALNRLKSIVCR